MDSDMHPMTSDKDRTPSRRWLVILLRFVVTAALLAIVIYRGSQADLIALIGWHLVPSVVLGLGLVAVVLFLNAVRWAFIARAIGSPLPMGTAVELTLIGHFFSQLLPTSVGGDVFRVWGARQAGLKLHAAVSSVLFERLAGLVMLVVLMIVGMPILSARIDSALPLMVAIVLIVGLAVGLLALGNLRRFPAVFRRAKFWAALVGLSQSANALLKRPRVLGGAFAFSLAVQIGSLALMWFIARELGAKLTLIDALTIVPAVTFLSSLPVSIGGWGVREAGLAGGFALLGLPIEAAIGTSILVGLLNLLGAVPGFLLVLCRDEKFSFSP